MAQRTEVDELEIHHIPDRHRYEAEVDGRVAAIAQYRDYASAVAFLHTQTMSGFERQGIATKLVKHVLADIEAQEKMVLPYCWFVADVIRSNPEFEQLVRPEDRPRFGL